jgi:hypothetical protein
MRKRLIVFMSCQRSGSSVTAGCFHRLGMSLGPFPLFGASDGEPLGFCEALPILEIDHRLHRATYGFQEDGIDYRLAGHILYNRRILLPDVRQLPEEWIREGIGVIQRLVESGEISGFKHPAAALFWDYWAHVLSHFPEVALHLVFLLRAPRAIASSYLRRNGRGGKIDDVLDLVAAYYWRLLQIRKTWSGPAAVVRFDPALYQADLQAAVERCGLAWDEALFAPYFDPARIHCEDQGGNHPVERIYEQLLEWC